MDTPIGDNKNQAFEYREGQFICHVYVPIQLDEHEEIEDLIYCISSGRSSSSSSDTITEWTRLVADDTNLPSGTLHLTLVRGHRAVHYHQIRALISDIENECKKYSPFTISLDKFVIYHNFEKTKEFLCLASSSDYCSIFRNFKSSLRKVIDQYATKLTQEDETQTTSAHCSLMYRDGVLLDENSAILETNRITTHCSDRMGSNYTTAHIFVKSIQVKIGKYIYDVKLNSCVGQL